MTPLQPQPKPKPGLSETLRGFSRFVLVVAFAEPARGRTQAEPWSARLLARLAFGETGGWYGLTVSSPMSGKPLRVDDFEANLSKRIGESGTWVVTDSTWQLG